MAGSYYNSILRINNQTGTSYTLSIADFNSDTITIMDNASANTVTVPPSVFPIGAQLLVAQEGLGQTSFVAGAGVTINAIGLSISSRYKTVILIQVALNEWDAYGTLDAPSYPASLKLFIDAGNPLSYSGSGTTVTDLIGTQNGTLINGVGYSSSNGGYFTFDGVNDYIDFGINTAIQPVTTATYSMWVNFSGIGTAWSFANFNTDRNGINTWVDGNGLRFELCSASSFQYTNYMSTGEPTGGVWYYITLSINGTAIKTYKNGTLERTIVQTIAPTNGVNPLFIGQSNGTSWPMNGKIAQMKIYNEMRSDAQVLTDFNEFKSRYGY